MFQFNTKSDLASFIKKSIPTELSYAMLIFKNGILFRNFVSKICKFSDGDYRSYLNNRKVIFKNSKMSDFDSEDSYDEQEDLSDEDDDDNDTSSENNQYACHHPTCSFKSMYKKQWKDHSKAFHTDGKTRMCCEKSFNTKFDYDQHFQNSHRKIEIEFKNPDVSTSYFCKINSCPYTTKERYTLRKHIHCWHKKVKPKKCCNVMFHTKFDYDHHFNNNHKKNEIDSKNSDASISYCCGINSCSYTTVDIYVIRNFV